MVLMLPTYEETANCRASFDESNGGHPSWWEQMSTPSNWGSSPAVAEWRGDIASIVTAFDDCDIQERLECYPYCAGSDNATADTASDFTLSDSTHTTLMVRNIARTSTQEDFVEALNASGYEGLYDFAYLPFRAWKKRNLGFAFVNLKTPQIAQHFYNTWHRSNSFTHRGKRSRHVTISVAKVQGREENVRLIENTANTKDGEHHPVAFVVDRMREFARTYSD